MKKSAKKKKSRTVVRRTVKKKAVSRQRTGSGKKPKLSTRKRVPPKGTSPLDKIGKITHYFPKVKAGVMKITKGTLVMGDLIHIKGHTTDFKQKVDSIQLDHVPLKKAVKGQEIGLKVKSRVRQNDLVYKSD